MNLSESPLAEYLRNDEPENNWDDIPDTLIQWPENVLTDLGRATLAALSLPDAGEPEIWQGSEDGPREAVFGAATVRRGEYCWWSVKLWEDETLQTGSSVEAELWGEQPVAKALELASAIVAAHALAEQWRAEREAKQ